MFTDRAAISATPAALSLDGRGSLPVTTWAGPWPHTDQWWNPDAAPRTRRLRCQLVDVHGRAYLATCRVGTDDPDWLLEGVYD